MRWLVEISPLGKSKGHTSKLCVDAPQWQPALQAARAVRGEEGPISGFSIELLDEGYRAVDPTLRLKYLVRKAGPEDEDIPTSTPRASSPSMPEASADASVTVLSERSEDPSPESPLRYREVAYAVATADAAEVERVLRQKLAELRASLPGSGGSSLVNLAAFAAGTTMPPSSPPLASLAWKSWRADTIDIVFTEAEPPKANKAAAEKAAAEKAAADKAVADKAAAEKAAADKAAADKAAAEKAAADKAAADKAAAEKAAADKAAADKAEAEKTAADKAAADKAAADKAAADKAAADKAAADKAAADKAAADKAAADKAAADKAAADKAAADKAAADKAAADKAAADKAAADKAEAEKVAAERASADTILQKPVAAKTIAAAPIDVAPPIVEPAGSQATIPAAPISTRFTGDDLITELFDACADLHFLGSTLEGAEFVLATMMEKLPSEAGMVSLYDINRSEFVVVCEAGGAGSALLARSSDRASLPTSSAQSRSAVVVARVESDEHKADPRWKALKVTPKSLVGALVERNGRRLGLIELINPLDGDDYSDSDGHGLTYIAQQFGEFISEHGITIEPELVRRAASKRRTR